MFLKKVAKNEITKSLLVSGLEPPPGPRLGGPHHGRCLVFFEFRVFSKRVVKHEHVKIVKSSHLRPRADW